ncbi:MAG: O-antigen ligase family protein [Gammaproteobacteria bacterium]
MNILVGCFFTWVSVSILWSLGADYALYKAISILVLGGWSFFAGVFIVGSSIERVKRFFSLVAMFGVLFSVQFTLLGSEYGQSSVLQNLSNDYIRTSIIISTTLLLFSIYYFMPIKKSYNKNIFLILIQLYLLIIVFSLGAKGPLVALFVSYVVLFLYLRAPQKKSFNFRKPIKYFIYLAGMVYFLPLIDYEQFRAVVRFTDLIVNSDTQLEFGGRIWLNLTALDMWEESPIIGKGIGSFGLHTYSQDFRAYPHNIFTETLAELGLIGLLLLVAIFFVTLRMVPRSDDLMFVVPYVVLIFYLITVQFSSSLSDHRLLFTLLGIVSASSIYLSKPKLNKILKASQKQSHLNLT